MISHSTSTGISENEFRLLLTRNLLCSRLEELGKLNYALDIELQKERENRQLMHARLTGTPRRTMESRRQSSSQEHSS